MAWATLREATCAIWGSGVEGTEVVGVEVVSVVGGTVDGVGTVVLGRGNEVVVVEVVVVSG